MDNMSLSDIAAVTKDKDNWADGGILDPHPSLRIGRRYLESQRQQRRRHRSGSLQRHELQQP